MSSNLKENNSATVHNPFKTTVDMLQMAENLDKCRSIETEKELSKIGHIEISKAKVLLRWAMFFLLIEI